MELKTLKTEQPLKASERYLQPFIDSANITRHGKCFDCGLYLTHHPSCQSGAALLSRMTAQGNCSTITVAKSGGISYESSRA